MTRAAVLLIVLAGAATARAEDGYELWLRYPRVSRMPALERYNVAQPPLRARLTHT